ncbi:MAG: leucine-rich repeat domain-containing protein [Gemmatimonadaceae bacterium]|nr:leucine-rich repeat domain-containing protein [Gemmatimonadaceae bacterium]
MKAAIIGIIGLLGSLGQAGAAPLLEGRVRLDSGQPVPDAQVLLFDLSDLRAPPSAATTDGSGRFTLPLGTLAGVLPDRFELGANYPNPFNPSTMIPYRLPASMRVRLEVFNLLGQRVATLVDGEQPAGSHTASWDATDAGGQAVGAGVYLYRLSGDGVLATRSMLLIDGQAGIASGGGLSSGLEGASGAGEDGGRAPVYGLTVSGPGVVPYVDPAFRVQAGMASVDVVVEAPGRVPPAKAASSGGILGDVDNTGSVDFFDALLVALYSRDSSIVVPNNGDISLGDVNADGRVGLADAWLIAVWLNDPSDPSLPAGIGEPVAAATASLSPDPSTVTFSDDGAWHRFTVEAGEPLSVVVNPGADSPRLEITTRSGRGNFCPAEAEDDVSRDDGQTLYLSGCSKGAATVELRRPSDGTVLRTYTFDVIGIPADLVVESVSVSDSTLTPGQSFTLRATVRNQGTSGAEATSLRWYRSTNRTISTRDTQVGRDAVGALAAEGTRAESVRLTAPSTEGTYYYGACVESLPSERGGNNCSIAVRVTVDEADTTPVSIPDATLRAGIEGALGKASGASITVHELKALNSLDAGNYTNGPGIRDLTGLESASNLNNLSLRYNTISDLSPLSALTNLTKLDLTEIHGSQVPGADRHSPLNLSPLSGLTNLTNLNLSQNKISDLSALSGLTNLTDLDLSVIHVIWDESNPPAPLDLSPLSGLTNLTWLNLAYNSISDLSQLSGLNNLNNLNLSNNQISDLGPLAASTGLGRGDIVNIKRNPLNATSKSRHIPALQAKGVQVLRDEVGEVLVFADPQIYNDKVFVLPVSENLAGGSLPLKDYVARFYEHFEDEFDFLMFVPNLSTDQYEPGVNIAAYYIGVMNDVQGIGISIYSDGSWGSGKLQGVINSGSNSIYSISERGRSILSEGPTLHELMHRWANSIVPSSHGNHWGFSSANGNIGGFDIADWVDHGRGHYSAGRFTLSGVADNVQPYSPIELYLAGFIPPEEVPDLWVAEDGEWLRDGEGRIVQADNGDPVFSASRVTTYTLEEIVAEHGPRVPNHLQAQKDFRAAAILLISDDYPATRAILETISRDVSWFSHPGDDESHRYNFYEATGGRGTMAMDGLSQFQDRGRAKRVIQSSFGTPSPPTVDHWE